MKRRLSLLTALAALVLAGCDSGKPTNASPENANKQGTPAAPAQVRLASSKNLWATLPIVALTRGFFANHQLQVRVDYVQAAKFAQDALVGGSADFGTVVETNPAFLAYTGHTDVTLVATICESDDSAIVAHKSAGINAPADLKGKRLGLLPGTTSHIFAERFLNKYGLQLADVKVANLQAPAMQAAFVEKGTDSVSIWEPFVSNIAKAGGDDAIVFKEPGVYVGLMNIAVRKSWAGAHRGEVVRFLQALREAEVWVKANGGEAQGLMAKELSLDPELVAKIWPQYTFALSLDAARLDAAIADEGVWIKRTQSGFAEKPLPDYATLKFVDPSFMAEVK